MVIFFLPACASAAYLTVSETFPPGGPGASRLRCSMRSEPELAASSGRR